MNRSNEIRFNAISERVPEDAERILDIGCARHNEGKRESASLHEYLIKHTKAEIKGIDILEKEIKKMRNEGYDVQVGDAETFESETDFDILVAGEVIEHVKNPGGLLENAERNLAPNGKLIPTTPNPDGFAYLRKAVFGQLNNPTHTCWIDPRNLEQLVSITETGLNVMDWQYLPPVGGVSTALWKMRLKRAASPGYVAELAIQSG